MSDSFWNQGDEMMDEEVLETPWWSRRPVLILFLAVVAVVVLSFLWHALLPKKGQGNVDVPYIKSETTPLKTRPENPGGADIPHKDKAVYNLIASNKVEEKKPTKIKPLPEKPRINTQFEAPAELSKDSKPASVVEDIKPSPEKSKKAAPKVDLFKDKDAKKEKPKSHQAKPRNQKKKTASKKAQGKFRMQLAALTSEKAAETQVLRLKKKFKLLKSQALNVEKVKVKGKTYYRIYAGRFTSRDKASQMCKKLKAAGGDCVIPRL